jgi:hypothetical protein
MKTLLSTLIAIIFCSSAAFSQVPPKEKMLIRFILQNEFVQENARLCESRKGVAEKLRGTSRADVLASISATDDPTMRRAFVLTLGDPGYGDFEKVRETLKRALKTEKDLWIRLEMARVLASFGDDAGKDVLVSALWSKDGYCTQSGRESGEAILPLLLLDYDFPEGLPKWAPNYEWGGLKEYFDVMRGPLPNLSLGDMRELSLSSLLSLADFWQGAKPEALDADPSGVLFTRAKGYLGGKVWKTKERNIGISVFVSQEAAVAAMEFRIKNVASRIKQGGDKGFAGRWWYTSGIPNGVFVSYHNAILEVGCYGGTYEDRAQLLLSTGGKVIERMALWLFRPGVIKRGIEPGKGTRGDQPPGSLPPCQPHGT